ncbi:hypothetical protein QF037_005472 [Streptomyces canus]|uniref:hypothetical protein n=1 Tax=Streptomyces canus TaxID=58343 RepID=UPI00278385BF|nr:hypothetical protein [Streptomyces canus]MDQ0601127.1 hypothetical protein [Streptomyces canus]
MSASATTAFAAPYVGARWAGADLRLPDTATGGRGDWPETDCPGQTMYDLPAEVRAAAAR